MENDYTHVMTSQPRSDIRASHGVMCYIVGEGYERAFQARAGARCLNTSTGPSSATAIERLARSWDSQISRAADYFPKEFL